MSAILLWEYSIQASTPNWIELDGTEPTQGKLRFKSANDNTNDTNDPLVRPGAGANYSFEKYTRVTVDTLPSIQVTDLRLLLSAYVQDSMFSTTGLTFQYDFVVLGSYATPVQPTTDGTRTTLTTAAISWDNSGTFLTSGHSPGDMWGDMVVLVLKVASTVVNGGELKDFSVVARFNEI